MLSVGDVSLYQEEREGREGSERGKKRIEESGEERR
jgi:hypothetical protein